jgi:aminoglycoside phosphotransferase (APT) family kinase protein
MTVATGSRSPDAIAAMISEWLQCENATVRTVRPFGTGASAETFSLTVSREPHDPGLVEYVVKTGPTGIGIFPSYDLAEQCRIMNALHRGGALTPAPAVHVETPDDPVGVQIMPLIAGDVPPSTAAPYTRAGWVVELAPERQRRLIDGFTTAMADVHRIDPAEIGLERGVLGKDPGLSGEFDWWSEYFEETKQGMPAELVDPIERAVEWCRSRMPQHGSRDSVLWGDSRLGNVIFDPDQGVAALCDWEMAGIGPAEWDLGYQFAHRNNSAWLAGKDRDLDGAPTRSEQIALYERRLGRPVEHLEWHEAAAGTRLAMMHLALRKIFSAGDGLTAWKLPPALPDWVTRKMTDYDLSIGARR